RAALDHKLVRKAALIDQVQRVVAPLDGPDHGGRNLTVGRRHPRSRVRGVDRAPARRAPGATCTTRRAAGRRPLARGASRRARPNAARRRCSRGGARRSCGRGKPGSAGASEVPPAPPSTSAGAAPRRRAWSIGPASGSSLGRNGSQRSSTPPPRTASLARVGLAGPAFYPPTTMNAAFLQRLFGLDGKVALVTGASGGIGSAIAHALAMAGADVALTGRSREKLEAVRAEIAGDGGNARAFPADLATPPALEQLVEAVHAELGRVDVLVNGAGINQREPIFDVTPATYDRILDTNLRSVYFLSQRVARGMAERGGGKIVHVGSINAAVGLAGVSVYGLSKA